MAQRFKGKAMDRQDLAQVLRDAKTLISLDDNDFSWSYWGDAETALAEIETHLRQIETGQLPDRLELEVIFAATGPMQELSMSSGWGTQFIRLADRFDDAIAGS
jgi:hypothetical protein